jgi:uncharacterized membrane protein YuzA (DUF378 family)
MIVNPQVIKDTTCITAVDLLTALKGVVGDWVAVTYTLAYITGICTFIGGVYIGWMLHKRRTSK